jgi:hypothetical protein
MTNRNPSPTTRFSTGRSGNPGGKPLKSRNRIQGDFLKALADDFEHYGGAAIERCRELKPWEYLRIIASLIPKGGTDESALEWLSSEDLEAVLRALRAFMVAEGIDRG